MCRRILRWRNPRHAHGNPASRMYPLPRVPAGIASLRRKANNHIRMNVFTDSSAEKEVLFTSVNVNIQERAQVADSANVDPRKRPKRFRYRHSSRLGVTVSRQPDAKGGEILTSPDTAQQPGSRRPEPHPGHRNRAHPGSRRKTAAPDRRLGPPGNGGPLG
jgi:hypothetical protein